MDSNNNQNFETDDSVDFKELFDLCLKKWYWFVISVGLTLFVAGIYLLRTPASFLRTAEVQIKNDSKGASIANASEAFANMGLVASNTSVNNELRAMLSPDIMSEVVTRLHLNVDYAIDGLFHDQDLYGKSLPIQLSVIDLPETACAQMDVHVNQGLLTLDNFVFFNEGSKTKYDESVNLAFRDTVNTPVGRVVIQPSLSFVRDSIYPVIHTVSSGILPTTERYGSKLEIALADKGADVLTLSFTDICTERADDIISSVIKVYNENWVNDKNQIAVGTSLFINDRLKVIEAELSEVDADISQYKSKNLLPDVKAAADLYMKQSTEIGNQLKDLNTQLYMIRYIRDYLSKEENQTQPLPASSGISNANIESQISEYNDKLLKRNRLEANSSAENALVKEMDVDLKAMRGAILVSIDNQIVAVENQISSLQNSERQAIARIASNPEQAKALLSVERQQAVKAALYTFLLQKREETALSQAFTAYNTRVIKKAGGSLKPAAPQKKKIALIAFALGLLIPLGIFYLKQMMNTTVRGKKDLDGLHIPLVGEIPSATQERPFWKFWAKEQEPDKVVVKAGKRDSINEAFRVMRTNLEFMSTGGSNVVMVTSYNAGSGKSFLSANTAIAMALKNKKVLVIDGDLRHASLSEYVDKPSVGLADYLSGKTKDSIQSLLVKGAMEQPTLDVLPVGTVPPNPAELLGNGLFETLVQELKQQYDYVIIDCPPVDIVADAHILQTVADRTLFVVRVGLLDRAQLPALKELQEEGKFKNVSLVLNAVAHEKKGYYGKSYYNSYVSY